MARSRRACSLASCPVPLRADGHLPDEYSHPDSLSSSQTIYALLPLVRGGVREAPPYGVSLFLANDEL